VVFFLYHCIALKIVQLKSMKVWFSGMLALFVGGSTIFAQEIVPLYQGAIPNSIELRSPNASESLKQGVYKRSVVPTLEVYFPKKGKETGVAVVICPGGAYGVIVYQGEGQSTAKELAKNGVTAFVLKYRLPSDSYMVDKTIGPLQDAQQAIKLIRENALKWKVNPNKIGIIGFSAGGHLASTAATHFGKVLVENPKGTSVRPDFQVLVYPVISMQKELTHADSRNNLLGAEPSKETADYFSNEKQVNPETPIAYLAHAADDNVVDVDNTILYFEALRKAKVPVEMHVYPSGNHGFIFKRPDWIQPLLLWMRSSKIIK
jgi:acetyl esterase/lipase